MADVPTTSWDETTPAGSDNASAGDDRIRELKTQIREVIDVDHDFPSSGQASDVGQHKQVTLQEAADIGTGAEGVPILGAQTAGGKAELTFTDEDDNDIQLTSGGKSNAAALGGVYAVDNLAAVANIMGHVYPVGCIYTNITGTNPGTELGVGTWTAFGAGRVLVGYDSGDADFDAAEETGGAKTVDLSHTHTVTAQTTDRFTDNETSGVSYHDETDATQVYGHNVSGTADSQLSATQSVVQPYIVVYFWKRTA